MKIGIRAIGMIAFGTMFTYVGAVILLAGATVVSRAVEGIRG